MHATDILAWQWEGALYCLECEATFTDACGSRLGEYDDCSPVFGSELDSLCSMVCTYCLYPLHPDEEKMK